MTAFQAMDPVSADLAQNCPVGTAITVLSGKWKLPILRPLYLHGPLRYGALLRHVDSIAPKELTRNLRELDYAGLLARAPAVDGKGDVYKLTELGAGLTATFRALGEFGTSYLQSRGPRADRSVIGLNRFPLTPLV
ncbi:DNA-binding HxlR family transcriptional regulator [Devosia sp. UYZn731]|uniref:winged helix-turn-helix transcriptional regulator n=1 Tax=Devosia sp. UYZn731 TaxID=3156345 RepID=UPI0033912015